MTKEDGIGVPVLYVITKHLESVHPSLRELFPLLLLPLPSDACQSSFATVHNSQLHSSRVPSIM